MVSVALDSLVVPEATRAGSAARSALPELEGGLDWQNPDQAFLGYAPAVRDLVQRASQRVEEGLEAYLNFEVEQAVERLSSAVADFDAGAAALEDPQQLGRALLFLGAAYALNQQTREARDAFARVHRQMPWIEPDPNLFNPDMIELFERSRPRDARRPQGTLHIESDPPGAIAYVDFVPRGRTPLDVEGLIAGEHIVRVVIPGHRSYVETVDVQRRRPEEVRATLSPVDASLEALPLAVDGLVLAEVEGPLEPDNPIAEVAGLLRLDRVGILRILPSGEDQAEVELLVFDTRDGRRVVRATGTVPTALGAYEEGVRELVTRVMLPALVVAPAEGEEPAAEEPIVAATDDRPAEEDGGPVTEQWWFWAAVGGGAALIAAGIIIGVAVGSQGEPVGVDPGGQVILEF